MSKQTKFTPGHLDDDKHVGFSPNFPGCIITMRLNELDTKGGTK